MVDFVFQRWSQQYLPCYNLFWNVILPFLYQEVASISLPTLIWENIVTVLNNKMWRKWCHKRASTALNWPSNFLFLPRGTQSPSCKKPFHVERSCTVSSPSWAPRWQLASSTSHLHGLSQMPRLAELSDDCSPSWRLTIIIWRSSSENCPDETNQCTES